MKQVTILVLLLVTAPVHAPEKQTGTAFLVGDEIPKIDDRTMARHAIAGAKQMILQSLTGYRHFWRISVPPS
jgi:hypothetical protein